jgi:acylphosphatase
MAVRAHVRVKGLVQGVSFRVETHDRARARGIAGWVRNLPDGDVEAVFEGERDQVEELLAWCRRGPRGARVERVDVVWEEPAGERAFVVR